MKPVWHVQAWFHHAREARTATDLPVLDREALGDPATMDLLRTAQPTAA